jgi:hypothetical protein
MHSFQHSRGRILFEVACAFGISASCVWAWQQTWSTAMLPAAAIAGLYGLVHAFDMIRRRPTDAESVPAFETLTGQGDLLADLGSSAPEPMIEAPKFAEPPAVVAETNTKRKRKSPKQARREEPVPEVVETAPEAEPEVAEAQVEDTAPVEPEYIPATPLFEPEPFVRQQRAAFGRKTR